MFVWNFWNKWRKIWIILKSLFFISYKRTGKIFFIIHIYIDEFIKIKQQKTIYKYLIIWYAKLIGCCNISHVPSLHQRKFPVRTELFCILVFTPRYKRDFHKIPINKRVPSLFVHNIYMLRMTWSGGIVRPS